VDAFSDDSQSLSVTKGWLEVNFCSMTLESRIQFLIVRSYDG